jgi:RNA polymerase sigma-70 factor, ECF subfamily
MMTEIGNPAYLDGSGRVEARYLAFLETVSALRPSLHRYCARMTGSIMDGEDLVQEALIEAYRKLDKYDESRPLKPWLFRIAHNRAIDFLRRKGVRDEVEAAAAMPEAVLPVETVTLGIGKAVEHLVASLPPKERACILLKEVFDYSLEEIAELVDSTVGGVKAALNRGRTKLAASPAPSPSVRTDPELAQIMQLYVDRFNRRDWDGVRELISADARLNVLDRFAGKFADAPYFFNYERWPWPWKLALGEVDGEPVLIVLQRGADTWTSYSVIRMKVTGQEIERIVDYIHCPWMVPAATSVSLVEGREMSD